MKKKIATIIFSLFFSIAFLNGISQSSMTTTFKNTVFKQGDTLNFEINLSDSFRTIKTASIHLWIENIATGRKWHYKYPLINGYLNARIIIDSNISPGNYALNFFMQKNFFRIKGVVKNAYKKDNQINYVLLSKIKTLYLAICQ